MYSIPFLKPRYIGKRFEDHTIPIDSLKDLVVLKNILEDLAIQYIKEKYLKKRLSSIATNSVSLHLSSVDEGSVTPTISLSFADKLIASPFIEAYENARDCIIKAITQASTEDNVTAISAENIRKFDRFGIGLQDDEKIELVSNEIDKAVYTQEIRHKFIKTSKQPQIISKDIFLKGIISAVNTDNNTFGFTPISSNQIISIMPEEYFETLHKYLSLCREGKYVSITGVGKYKNNQLLSIIEIESISEVDEMDIEVRLHTLNTLTSGWLGEGIGEPVDKNTISWIGIGLTTYYPASLPIPYLYPTEEGGISAEWDLTKGMAVLEVYPGTKITTLYTDSNIYSIDMNELSGWNKLAEYISSMEEITNA